jgi:hypothetical protein
MRNEKTSSTKTNGPGNLGWPRSVPRASSSSCDPIGPVDRCQQQKPQSGAEGIYSFSLRNLIDTLAIRNVRKLLKMNGGDHF